MNKDQFEKFNQICRDEWLRISRLPKANYEGKSVDIIHTFAWGCPACEIAVRVCDALHKSYQFRCEYCPISVWRTKTTDATKEFVPCQDEGIYGMWIYASFYLNSDNAKAASLATTISMLYWEWMKEYELVIPTQEQLEFVVKEK